MPHSFAYKFLPPDPSIAGFVESIGMFYNATDTAKEVVVLPDGRVDLFFTKTANGPFSILLMGLETYPEQRSVPPQMRTFVISFKPLAAEYILGGSIADFLNSAKAMPDNFWQFSSEDLEDFDAFYVKASQTVQRLLPQNADPRKHRLFDLIYSSNGEMSVKDLSAGVGWSSRQINRYFNNWFGLSLKAYCTILRFRASLAHIAEGKLFPQMNFTDQTHFIKEVKKFSGVVPKELALNKDDRFVLLSVLKQH